MNPTYRGNGVTMWPGNLVCPYSESSMPLQCAYFWPDPRVTYPYTPRGPISGMHTEADATVAWSFELLPPG